MPEVMEFGSKTITYTAALIAVRTVAGINMLLYEHGLDTSHYGGSKMHRLFQLFKELRESGDAQDKCRLADVLCALIPLAVSDLEQRLQQHGFSTLDEPETVHTDRGPISLEQFRSVLRADGYEVQDGKLVPAPSSSVDFAAEKGKLEVALETLGFTLALNHLDQAVDNIGLGHWEAANAQIRSFLENVFDEIAARRCQDSSLAPKGGNARKYLHSIGFINGDLEDNLVKCFFELLHTAGSHPGLSDEQDCLNRLLMAVGLAYRYVQRFAQLQP